VLAAFAAACVDIVDLKNIHYNINMLNDSHQKTASWVNPGIGADRLAGRRLRLKARDYGQTYFLSSKTKLIISTHQISRCFASLSMTFEKRLRDLKMA
jgi:hypothetical protein